MEIIEYLDLANTCTNPTFGFGFGWMNFSTKFAQKKDPGIEWSICSCKFVPFLRFEVEDGVAINSTNRHASPSVAKRG